MMHYNYGYHDFGFVGSALHILGWIVIVAIVILIIKSVVRGGRPHMRWHADPAMDLLREKYVKGEITKEEFESKKKDLMS